MKTLEKLWYHYQQEAPMEDNEELIQLLIRLDEYEQALKMKLTEDQWNLFQSYDRCLGEIGGIAEASAFVKGVRFATAYLLESMNLQ